MPVTRVPQPHLTAPRGRFFILCPLRATFHGTATCWASSCAPLQAWSHFHLTAILILGHRRAALAAHPHSSRPGVLVSSSLPGPGPARGAPSGQHLGLQLWPGLRRTWRRLAPDRVSHAPVALGCPCALLSSASSPSVLGADRCAFIARVFLGSAGPWRAPTWW